MEGPQGRCVVICERVYDLLTEQFRAYAPGNIITCSIHSREEMGECVDGLYHRFTGGTGHRFHICSGRSIDQVCTLIFYLIIVEGNTSGRFFFREVFRIHGLLRYIVSDRDKMFLNDFLVGFVQVGRHIFDSKHQLSPSEVWSYKYCEQMD
jgi:hypothetical protein